MDGRPQKQIIAKYSAVKVGAWVALVAALSAWTLADGASRGWRLPEGAYGGLFPVAVVGSLVGLITSAAITLNLGLARGVAIAKVGDTLVLYFPFGRKRVALQPGVTVSATEREIETPLYGTARWFFKTPPVAIAKQITIHRPEQVDLNFQTGLLRDSPDAIAKRMSALIDRP